ncbi:MAG: hypothetical protein K0R68_217 [Mycobacterium sp.]|nr:hypothetical protein [Mycobacterium sp.]
MVGGSGCGTPYAAVVLIFGVTESPSAGAYVRGKLALAGLDLSADLGVWLDAVYAVWIDAPHEMLEKAQATMVRQIARLRPEEARETWGLRPEHQAMAGKLGKGAQGAAPTVGPASSSQAEIDRWVATQGRRLRK